MFFSIKYQRYFVELRFGEFRDTLKAVSFSWILKKPIHIDIMHSSPWMIRGIQIEITLLSSIVDLLHLTCWLEVSKGLGGDWRPRRRWRRLKQGVMNIFGHSLWECLSTSKRPMHRGPAEFIPRHHPTSARCLGGSTANLTVGQVGGWFDSCLSVHERDNQLPSWSTLQCQRDETFREF